MADDTVSRDGSVDCTRRRWLQTAVAASTVGLAGCSNGGGNPNDTPSDTSRPNVVDGTFKIPWTQTSIDIPTAELNRWGKNFAGTMARHVYSYMGGPSNTNQNEWYHLDMEGWTLDEENDELRVTLKDDVYWTQGGETIDPVTAEDWAVMEQLLRYMTPASERSSDPAVVGWRVEGENDEVLVKELNPDGYNPGYLIADLEARYVTTYRNGFYAEKLEELKNASGEDAKSQVRQDISAHQTNLQQDPPLNGPYMLEDVNSQRATFTINSDHWVAKAGPATPRNFEIKIIGGGSNAGYQAVQSGNIDLTLGGIPSSVPTDAVPSQVKQIASENGSGVGTTLLMNYGGKVDSYMGVDTSKPVEERVAGPQQAKIRQAVAHAIKFDDVLTNHLGSRAADIIDPYQRAIPSTAEKVTQEFPDLYETLPSYTSTDADKAAQRLEEAGLSQNGSGTWVKPDGSPLTITLQAFSTNAAMMQTVRDDLEAVGLQAELDTLGSSLWNQYLEGTYSVGRGWIQGGFPLDIQARQKLAPAQGWPPSHRPANYEVPPVGEMDAETSETVNVSDLTESFLTENFDAHTDAVRKLIWTYAYHLPDIPMFTSLNSVTVNTNNLSWPESVPDGSIAAAGSDHNPVYGVTNLYYVLAHSTPGMHVAQD